MNYGEDDNSCQRAGIKGFLRFMIENGQEGGAQIFRNCCTEDINAI